MAFTPSERAVLDRYREKTHLAGEVRVGYVMRRESIAYYQDRHPDVDYAEGIRSLEEKGLLASGENPTFVFLTDEGAKAVEGLASA